MIKRVCDICGMDMPFPKSDEQFELSVGVGRSKVGARLIMSKPHGPASEGPDYCRSCVLNMLEDAINGEKQKGT
jgi:hypothetical protein